MAPKLSIAVVEQDHDRALMIVDGLREAGDYDITVLGDVTGLARRLAALEERKVVDRAKGMLMKAKGLSEEEAYAALRRTAMAQGRKVADVAQALITAADLLK